MTLEEKIERLRELSKEINRYEDTIPLYQGDYIDLAMLKDEVFEIIATLEQEPCEDEISRDAVLEKAVYTETEEGWCGYTVDVDYIKSLPPVNPQEADPCDFCSTIYPDADTKDIVFREGKYSDVNKDSFITIDDEEKYHVNIDPGDPYEIGCLCNIKFCPYCGRKLTERSDKETYDKLKEYKELVDKYNIANNRPNISDCVAVTLNQRKGKGIRMSDIEEKKLCCPCCGRSIYEMCISATIENMKKIIDKMYPDGIFKESYIMSKEEFEMLIKRSEENDLVVDRRQKGAKK